MLIKIDTRYTIKFSKGGICQYADFNESKGKIVHPTNFWPSWAKVDEIPSLDGLKTIEEILKAIKEFSYCNQAELYLINGMPTGYCKNKKARKLVDKLESELEKFIENKAVEFFESILEPLMKKNKWFISRSHIGMPVLITKDKKGEWDNVPSGKKQDDFEYLCYSFASNFNNEAEAVLRSEHGNRVRGFSYFVNYIPNNYFYEKGLWIDL